MNQYEVYMDIEPLEGEPFSVNRGVTENPLRIEFNIKKDIRLDPNNGEIRVYNLSQEHQQALAYRYDIGGAVFGGKVTLYAGYIGESKQIFSGNVVRSYPERRGGDVVTYIQVMHVIKELRGGVVRDSNFPKGTKQSKILDKIVKSVKGFSLSPDQKTKVDTLLAGLELKNSESYDGASLKVLQRFSDRFANKVNIFFDENGPHILGPGESNGDDPLRVDQFSGLMGSPSITDVGANIRIRLNPGLRNGSPIEVDSTAIKTLLKAPVSGINKGLVGKYIAEKITHIGDNYPGGEWTTEIEGIYEGGAI